MKQGTEAVLALALIIITGGLSFAVILLVYRLCCHVNRRRWLADATSGSRDDADRKLLGSATPRSPRSDLKQLKRSAVRTETRVKGLYAGVKSLRLLLAYYLLFFIFIFIYFYTFGSKDPEG